MGKNICEGFDQQGINFQNMQIAQTAQYQKINNQSKKGGGAEDLNRHFTKEDMQVVVNRDKKRCFKSVDLGLKPSITSCVTLGKSIYLHESQSFVKRRQQ